MSNLDLFAENQTRAQLRTGPSPERLAELAVKIDQMADGAIKAAHLVGPAVACGKGCSHCCQHQFVTAAVPEVLHLASAIQSTYTPERLRTLRERIDAYLAITCSVAPSERLSKVRSTCPILEGDLCGAFEARPLACRRHNSTDVEACVQYKEGVRKIPALANGEQLRVGNSLLSGWAIGLRRCGLQEAIVELIPALDIALRVPDAAERYLAGEPVFDSVIVAGYDPAPIRRAIKARRAQSTSIEV